MQVVLIAPAASNPFTGGHLFNARVAAAAPAGSCTLRSATAAEVRTELARNRPRGHIVALDSLFLAEEPPVAGAGAAVIQVVHSLPAADAAVQAALAAALGCITTSAFMADAVRRRVPTRARVCRPGVAATLRVAAATHAVPVVLTVANFERRKGHLPLLRALARLGDLAWNWQVIGDLDADPACAAEFRAAVASSGLGPRITVLGRQHPEAVQRRMAAADLFALLSEREPYGMVYAEAVASGTPVVAWRDGGVLETVVHGDTGLLAPLGDLDAAAAHLRALLSDPARRAGMRQACAAAAAGFPTWSECAADFVACCRTLAGGVG